MPLAGHNISRVILWNVTFHITMRVIAINIYDSYWYVSTKIIFESPVTLE